MNYDEKLSKNFNLSEFTESRIADKYDINNVPSATQIASLRDLVKNLMQPIRDYWGLPVRITSGYRCNALNVLIGGAEKSQHLAGKACDFTIKGLENIVIVKALKQLKEQGKIKYDQLILEPTWIHISYDDINNRGEELTKLKSGYIGGFDNIE